MHCHTDNSRKPLLQRYLRVSNHSSPFHGLPNLCLPNADWRIIVQVKLTAGFVATAGAPVNGKDRIIYWDEKRPGFGLMMTVNGKRSFVFQYRNGQGDSRRASLSGTTKLADAHKWADILQGDVAKGVDPVEKKKADRVAQSKRGRFRT